MTLRIKDWKRFQHFKDRMPPWIKLYRSLLDDPEWHQLDIKLIRPLVNMWLIASDDENKQGTLPSIQKLAFRMRVSISELENVIIPGLSHWLIQDDIRPISGRYQLDAPETETETETENTLCDKQQSHEINIPHKRRKPRSVIGYTDAFLSFWSAYPKQVGKQVAFESWKRLLKDGFPEKDLIVAAEEYAKARDGKEQEFTLHPSTFLNKGRWKDYCFEDDTPKEVI